MLVCTTHLHAQNNGTLPLSLIESWELFGTDSAEREAIERSIDDPSSAARRDAEIQRLLTSGAEADAVRLNHLALAQIMGGDTSSAETIMRHVVKVMRRAHRRADHPDYAAALANLGLLYYHRFHRASNYIRDDTKFRESLAMRRRIANGKDDPRLAASLRLVGAYYFNHRDSAAARPLLEESIAMRRRLCVDGNCPELAATLYDLAVFCNRSGDSTRADALFGEALSICAVADTGAPLPGFASVLDAVAGAYIRRRNYAAAVGVLGRAVRLRGRWYAGTDRPEIARDLSLLGECSARMGNFAAADTFHTEALAISRRLHARTGLLHVDDATLALRMGLLGDVCLRRGDPDAAIPVLKESLELYRRNDTKSFRVEVFRAFSRLGWAYDQRGDFSIAGPLFDSAVVRYRRLTYQNFHDESMSAHIGMGRANDVRADYRKTGRMFGAIRRMAQYWDAYEEYELACAEGFSEVGGYYTSRGRYSIAEIMLEDAMAIFGRYYRSSDDPAYARCLHNMALYYHQRGDLARAASLCDSALAMRRRLYPGTDHRPIAESLGALSAIEADQGDTAESRAHFEEYVAMLRRLYHDTPHFDLALAYTSLGSRYVDRGEYQAAATCFERASSMYDTLCGDSLHPDRAYCFAAMAYIHAYRGDLRKADSLFTRAWSTYDILYSKTGDLEFLLGLHTVARFADRGGRVGQADTAYTKMLKALPKITRQSSLFEGEERQLKFQRRLSSAVSSLASFFLRNNQTGDLFNTVLRTKGNVLTAIEWRNRVLRERGRHDEGVRKVWEQYREARMILSDTRPHAEGLSFERWDSTRRASFDLVDSIDRILTYQSSDSLLSRQRPTSLIVARNLQPGAAAVEFTRIPYVDAQGRSDSVLYYALVLRRDGYPKAVRLCEERELEKVLSFQVSDVKHDQKSYINDVSRATKLYNYVWAPVEKLLESVRTVYLSPDGLLNSVAFAALKEKSGRMLLDRHDLRYVFSTRDIVPSLVLEGLERREGAVAAVFGGVCYSADSASLGSAIARLPAEWSLKEVRDDSDAPGDCPPCSGSGLSALEGTRREAREITGLLEKHGYGVRAYGEADASEEAFSRLHSPAVLHMATHGYFYADSGLTREELLSRQRSGGLAMIQYSENPLLRSGILLAGACRVWDNKAPIDGISDGVVTAYDVAHMDLSRTELVVLSACETGLGDIMAGEGVFGLRRAFRAAGARAVIMSLWEVPDGRTQELMTLFYENWLDRKMGAAEALNAAQLTMSTMYNPYDWAAFVLVGE